MSAVLLGWPYLGLALGIAGLLYLALARRPEGAPPRGRDPAWLACVMLPVYMLHQFEEHGIDALGRRYHFIVELCTTLGHPDLDACPADPVFIFAVNVGAVWIAGVTAIAWRRRNPLVSACSLGIPLVNAAAHLGPAIFFGRYNSGLLSGTLVFVPVCFFALRGFVRAGAIPARRVPVVVASGGVVHAVLAGALLAYGAGWLPYLLMIAIQTLNGFVPLAMGTLFRVPARGGEAP
ncbi:MAG TPA: HXXEE domain-containing protein [Polyangiaceae bacterium]